MSVTGHHSINSLAIYEKVSNVEKLQMGVSMKLFLTCWANPKSTKPSLTNYYKLQTNTAKIDHHSVEPCQHKCTSCKTTSKTNENSSFGSSSFNNSNGHHIIYLLPKSEHHHQFCIKQQKIHHLYFKPKISWFPWVTLNLKIPCNQMK